MNPRMLFGICCLLVLSIVLPGCTHSLSTQADFDASPSTIRTASGTVGVVADYSGPRSADLVDDLIQRLNTSGAFTRVFYPYNPATKQADYVIRLTLDTKMKGYSGNFFVAWPGYYIFLPAIHGFKYRHYLNFSANVERVATNSSTDVVLSNRVRIRHADFNRTWIQAGWLWLWPFWDVAAIIGGAMDTRYDKSITREAVESYRRDYVRYIVEELNRALNRLDEVP